MMASSGRVGSDIDEKAAAHPGVSSGASGIPDSVPTLMFLWPTWIPAVLVTMATLNLFYNLHEGDVPLKPKTIPPYYID